MDIPAYEGLTDRRNAFTRVKGADVYHITIIKLNTNIITKEYIEESLDDKLFIRKKIILESILN